MSTIDEVEVKRLGAIEVKGWPCADCPVSVCHRAATGNIAIFAGCERPVFEAMLPYLTKMGRRIRIQALWFLPRFLKVVTNYLATANLVSCSALATCQAAGMDLNTLI